jgi:chromosome segregation protein
MRLERLEIHGFKSFSDRAELTFDHGVTAIVGPNGCGKSNVADAITWVLGEQSAKSLRGDRMEDVIFGGSDARKPGGAAEVRVRLKGLAGPSPGRSGSNGHDALADLPLAPADGDVLGAAVGRGARQDDAPGGEPEGGGAASALTRDVEITRRLYRSGESEYLIDGEVCRLRDVHELVMDTGLGAKAYAIIEQGKIGMILSSRPTDRRQLIDEAAGVTKYKSRRRSAELKLEAAQQNLTRIDDIIFEVEKQRGALRRQAAKARRYRRLREELRRWEKVLFARRYRELARAQEQARARLAGAQAGEAAAAARVAEFETGLARLRLEQAEADGRAVRLREQAHERELDISRRQQQLDFHRHETELLAARRAEIAAEMGELEAKREPSRAALAVKREALGEAEQARDRSAAALAAATGDQARAQQRIEGLESDVEGARGEVFSTMNAASALRHAKQHADAEYDRVAETLARLDVESEDLSRETERIAADREGSARALDEARRALGNAERDLDARRRELTAAREQHEAALADLRAREQALAGLSARLTSLEELVGSRAEFSDAARMVLVQANGHIAQQGALADYLEVDRRYERAVEACLGDLLQHVIVERYDQAAAGLSLVRERQAGRCGFVVIASGGNGYHPPELLRRPGIVPLADVVRVQGPHLATISKVLPEAYVAETFEQAVAVSHETSAAVATLEGDVVRGPHLVSGGAKAESRGILATRREIKELRERVDADQAALDALARHAGALASAITVLVDEVARATAGCHEQEKRIVAVEAQVARSDEEKARVSRLSDVVAMERRRALEEQRGLDQSRAEAEESIRRLENAQQTFEERLGLAQHRLAEGRDEVAALAAAAADRRAELAALLERASALAADVARLEDDGRELEDRIAARAAELEQADARLASLAAAIDEGRRSLDRDVLALDTARGNLREGDDRAAAVRERVEAQELVIRTARQVLDECRRVVSELEVERATAEGDISHLAAACADALQQPIERVLDEVAGLERSGEITPDVSALDAPDADSDDAEEGQEPGLRSTLPAAAPGATPEEVIAHLRARVESLGPVNMMAIEQFDELDARHTFLTTQRQDLIDSIAQTAEAITQIDATTRARFADAFTAIQANFQRTFATLFGGGRAGLALVDENDPLESGIDIVASPPGKRLQNVQLLSGGEKALTAIALMFAIFEYKPSPFCLLDEIDAPLDDANVARFVEMLQGMLDRTQFILITHNRRTMEIADRLYGVTMEEPGVSKLISVELTAAGQMTGRHAARPQQLRAS